MATEESKEIVWNALTQALKSDRYRTKILKISEIGLVEMTRKRVRESLLQTLCDPCSYCEGKGHIKSATTVSYELIRAIQRMANDNVNSHTITVQVHPSVYDLIFDEESDFLDHMEAQFRIQIHFEVNPKLHQEKYHIVVGGENSKQTIS